MEPASLLKKLFPPMLATLVADFPRDEQNWTLELKYDGFRAVSALSGGSLALWSRNALDLSSRFPEVAAALRSIGSAEVVLDGEIVVLDEKGAPRFQLLQQGNARNAIYVVFDLLWMGGKDLRRAPLEERRALLEKFLASPAARSAKKVVRIAEQVDEPARIAVQIAAERGYEGLIGKLKGSTYESRRSKSWIKIKVINMQEVAIVGFTPSTYSEKELGALLVGVIDAAGEMRYAGKVGTGFTARIRQELQGKLLPDRQAKPTAKDAPRRRDATWVTPRLVAQVKFTEWTSDGKLRHPSFLGLRPDKKPEECVREIPSETPAAPETKKRATKKAPQTAARRRAGSSGATPAGASARQTGNVSAAPRAPAGRNARAAKQGAAAVRLTHPERVLYPRDGITKQDVADYFAAVSTALLPALRDRPLTLEHWNQGIDRPSWFHQNIGLEAQPWMRLVETPTRTSSRAVRHFVADSPEALQWLAQHSTLTIHMWHSRAGSVERPDWVVFDLDPAKGSGIERAVDTALVLRRLFDSLEISTVIKTSGKRGLHLFVPLAKGYTYEQSSAFAIQVSRVIASQLPFTTTERAIANRAGRLYLDAMQNAYGKTVVAPYSLRAIDGAPVSAPLKWSEVNRKLDPLRFNLRTMPERLARVGDLFRPALEHGVRLPRLR